MLKKIPREKTAFERYFKEADEEEDKVSVTVAPRKNRGTDYGDETNSIRVAPRTNRGTNYGDGADELDTESDGNETTEPTPDEPDLGDGGTDYGDGVEDEGGENDTGEEPVEGDDDEVPDEPDLGDGGTDYGDDSAGEDGESEGDDASSQDTEESEEEKDEKLKKFHMYKRYIRLYNNIDTFIEKMRNVVKPNAIENAVIKTTYNNLSDIHSNMFDFMTMRYKNASYVEVLIYFETVLSAVRLNFELLRNNKINLKQ